MNKEIPAISRAEKKSPQRGFFNPLAAIIAAILALFGSHTTIATTSATQTAAVDTTLVATTTLITATSTPTGSTGSSQASSGQASSGHTTIIEQPIIQKIFETLPQQPGNGISSATLAAILTDFENQITAKIAAVNPSPAIIPQYIAAQGSGGYSAVNNISQLSNTTVNSPTISGGSLTNTTVNGYLPLTGGTLTGGLAGTDLNLSGALTAGTLNVTSLSSFGAIVGPYFTATSTTATSTFAGGFNVANGGLVYDRSTGFVGIGTSAPAELLTVNRNTNAENGLDVINTLTGASSASYLWVTSDSANGGLEAYSTSWNPSANDFAGKLALGNVAGALSLYTSSNAPIEFYTGGVFSAQKRMVITATGNVGIGTTTPSQPLEIWKSQAAQTFAKVGNLNSAGVAGISFANDASDAVGSWIGLGGSTQGQSPIQNRLMIVARGNADGVSIGANAGGTGTGAADIRFMTNGYTNAGYERMRITSTGNIGIGQTLPTYLLDVNGTGHFNSFVDAANFVATSTTATSTFAGGATFGVTGVSNVTIGNPTNYQINTDGLATTTPLGLLTVNGLGSFQSTLIGGYKAERNFNIFFPNDVANQKVKLYWPVGARAQGLFKVTIVGGYVDGNSNGALEKDFGVYGRSSGQIVAMQTSVPVALGFTPSFYSISDLQWDATAGAWSIVITNNSSAAEDIVVNVTSITPYNEATDPGADQMYFGNVYTTDTTVYPLLSTSFPLKFGVGTSSPYAALSIMGTNGGTIPLLSISSSTAAYATSTAFIIDKNGLVGIGTSAPTTALQVAGVITPNADNTSSLGNSTYRWSAVYAANGTIQTSDARLKSNVIDLNYGLPDILKLRPVSFTWTAHPEQGTKLGFIAQEVQPIMPETVTVGDDANHTLGITYTEFIPAIVKAIQDIANTTGAFQTNLIAWLGNATNGIQDLFANNIYASNDVHAKNEVCIGQTCINEAQLKALLAAAGQTPSAPTSPSQNNSSPTPPVISINGSNPATISVGDTYADPGATITGPQADLNLDIATYLNGAPASSIQIDTSTTSTNTIDYVVTDQAGNTSTSTRTVIVQ